MKKSKPHTNTKSNSAPSLGPLMTDTEMPKRITFSISYFGTPDEIAILEIQTSGAPGTPGGQSSKADYAEGKFSIGGFEMMSSVPTGEGFCFGFARNDLERAFRFLHKKAEARRRREEADDDED